MAKILGAKGGAVNVFSVVNDSKKEITLVMDHRLMNDVAQSGFHPMINTCTTFISQADLKKVIQLSGHEPTVIDFSKLAEEVAAAAPAPKAKPAKQEGGKKKVDKTAGKKEDVHQLGIEFKKHENLAKWYS
jgi:prolyl-tRNA synthetase